MTWDPFPQPSLRLQVVQQPENLSESMPIHGLPLPDGAVRSYEIHVLRVICQQVFYELVLVTEPAGLALLHVEAVYKFLSAGGMDDFG